MTDHSPQIVDTIARALYDHRKSTADPEDWPDDAAFDLHGDDVRDFWRGAARAVLAAMPQPIGYALLEDLPPEGDLPRDTYLREWVYRTPAEADSYNDTDNTRVVALVPAGDDHA